MKIAVIADNDSGAELSAQGLKEDVKVQWLKEIILSPGTDIYIDLSFTHNSARIEELKKLQPALIIVHSVTMPLTELPQQFIRINGWPTFLNRSIIEASGNDIKNKAIAEAAFTCFNKTTEWVPDVPGFISARVVSMIINEAYFALQEDVSSREEIDAAMKLGTNYPFGPFEWSKKIGLKNVYGLLSKLAEINSRYQPADLLKKEALYK
jgi:3-hydroxybutyryl-CoA dehydrogenase